MSILTVIGTLSADPDLRYTTSGKSAASFRIGENNRRKVNNEWTDNWTNYNNCEAWGSLAENLCASAGKGDRLICTGRMETQTYEHEGKTREKLVFVVEECGPTLKWATTIVERNPREER